MRLIKVNWRAVALVVDMDDARAAGAPVVFEKLDVQAGFGASGLVTAGLPLNGNVRGPATGRARRRRRRASRRRTSSSRASTEPKRSPIAAWSRTGIVADWRADGLTVYISTQFTAGVRAELARALRPAAQSGAGHRRCGWAEGSVRRPRSATTVSPQWRCRARHGAPVRLVVNGGRRNRSIPATGRRLAAPAHRRAGATAGSARFRLLSYGSAGTALGAGVGNVASRLYACANYEESHRTTSSSIAGRAAPCARRAPCRARSPLEQAIDELAQKSAWNPIALRDRIDPSPARREEQAPRRGAHWLGAHGMQPGADKGPDQDRAGHGAIAVER